MVIIFVIYSLLNFYLAKFIVRNHNIALPRYYGYLAFIASIITIICYSYGVPALILMALQLCILYLIRKINARIYFEKIFKYFLLIISSLACLITFFIILSIIFETKKFFDLIPFTKFITGTIWQPNNNLFGVIPLITGTLLISFIAIFISIPLGVFSAIFLNQYASKKMRNILKPMIELLAGIPTIIYGYFASIYLSPLIRNICEYFNISTSSESALGAGIIMGVMIIPFMMSLTDDALTSVPKDLKDASLALGATKSETIHKIMIPAAKAGIITGIILSFSRAIGETMIVTMAAGLRANLTINPLDSVTTITVQIVNLIAGDQEFDSPKTLAAYALAFSLFIITLALNLIITLVVRKNKKNG